MDTVHTQKENGRKVQALIDAVHMLTEDVKEHKYNREFIVARIESLDVLASEAKECLDTLRLQLHATSMHMQKSISSK